MTFNYTYDEHNRLWKVQDGSTIREYRYDDNGNRIYASNMEGTVGATSGDIVYDDQDRLLKYGSFMFDYTPKGDLWHRYAPYGTLTYDYDSLGALRSVRLPNGYLIEYWVDGRGRRVGKKLNAVKEALRAAGTSVDEAKVEWWTQSPSDPASPIPGCSARPTRGWIK